MPTNTEFFVWYKIDKDGCVYFGGKYPTNTLAHQRENELLEADVDEVWTEELLTF